RDVALGHEWPCIPKRCDPLGDTLQSFSTACGKRKLGPGLGQLPRQLLSDARRSSSNQHGFILKIGKCSVHVDTLPHEGNGAGTPTLAQPTVRKPYRLLAVPAPNREMLTRQLGRTREPSNSRRSDKLLSYAQEFG